MLKWGPVVSVYHCDLGRWPLSLVRSMLKLPFEGVLDYEACKLRLRCTHRLAEEQVSILRI